MKETAFVVTLVGEGRKDIWTPRDKAEEMRELVLSTGCEISGEMIVKLREINPRYFLGKGKVEEVKEKAHGSGSQVIIFSQDLSPAQQLNIEEEIGIKTIDRTQLILDIFAHHARGAEGKLQVELAQLKYLLPRLKGKGILLSRLGGGIGTRGPGEKKLEIDRRRIRRRIEKLLHELEEVRKRRSALRKRRQSNEIPVIALVGYTNAGKTTLLNQLTDAQQPSSDAMFTTLDPVARVYLLPGKQKVLLLDTVGFLNELPHHLIEAFKATLEEVSCADLILHVLDISHPLYKKRESAVYKVLDEIGGKDIPVITVLNKVDLLSQERISSLKVNYPHGVFISALKGYGIEDLKYRIKEFLSDYESWLQLYLPRDKIHLVKLLPPDKIVELCSKNDGLYLRARVNLATREKFYHRLRG
jgi:GTP-binding protein HflX